jgi:hypothetical protein
MPPLLWGVDMVGTKSRTITMAATAPGLSQTAPNVRITPVVAGHSFGGIIARYLAMLLFEEGTLAVGTQAAPSVVGEDNESVDGSVSGARIDDSRQQQTQQYRAEPVLFVTFATPHLGVRRPQRVMFNQLFHLGAGIVGGLCGIELLLHDDGPPSDDLARQHEQQQQKAEAEQQVGSTQPQAAQAHVTDASPATAAMLTTTDDVVAPSFEAARSPHLLARMTAPRFVRALATFRARYAYGNVVGDLMVPLATVRG